MTKLKSKEMQAISPHIVLNSNEAPQETGLIIRIDTDKIIKEEVKKFEKIDADLKKLQKEYLPLKIAGVEDKDGYIVVHKAWQDIRTKRLAIAKLTKELCEDAKKIVGGIKDFGENLIAKLEPIENHLKEEKDKVDNEKERLKQEKEQREQLRLTTRISDLISNGCAFNGASYSISDISINPLDLKAWSDEIYGNILQAVKDQNALAIKKKKEEDEAKAKKEAAEKAEKEALAKRNKELEERLAKMDEDNKKTLAENEKLKAEKAPPPVVLEKKTEETLTEVLTQPIVKKSIGKELKKQAAAKENPDKAVIVFFSEKIKIFFKENAPAFKDPKSQEIIRTALQSADDICSYLLTESNTL